MHCRHRYSTPKARCSESEPFDELCLCIGVMHATFEQLAAALRRHDRALVHAAAHDFVAAWSRSHILLGQLATPNEDARDAVASARRALRAAGEVVDVLFGDALVRAPREVQQFVTDARVFIAAALDRDRDSADQPEPR